MIGGANAPTTRAIDLGLPSGTLWADRNIGASAIEGYGLYFSWGNTEGHDLDSGYNFSADAYNLTPGAALTGDITAADDAAAVLLGGDWRLPTRSQLGELISNCAAMDITINGVPGCRLTSAINGKSVFFPYAGSFTGQTMVGLGTQAKLWLANINDNTTMAFHMSASNGRMSSSSNLRSLGYNCRAVK